VFKGNVHFQPQITQLVVPWQGGRGFKNEILLVLLLVLVLDLCFRLQGRPRGRFHLAAGHFFGKIAEAFMDYESFLKQRLLCITSVDRAEDAVPLAEALLAGGLSVMEITFRTAAAAESIQRVRQKVPQMSIGAGTLLSPEQVQRAIDVGAQFGVSPGLNEAVLAAATKNQMPFFPGVMTPTEVDRALNLGWKHLKFFPAEPAGGAAMLKALAAPFAHTGVKLIPTGSINAAKLPDYLALPQVAAVGGSWMAERKLVAEKQWTKITALTAEALKVIAQAKA
jgi:2-dehydro-3-deoxyphosphogluconate aldolase/(4S)-4-hydroxy-2-oxoglutarate aldolase